MWEEKIHSSVRERKRERREGRWKEFHRNKDPTRGGVVLGPPQGLFSDHAVRSDTEVQHRRPNGAAATRKDYHTYHSMAW